VYSRILQRRVIDEVTVYELSIGEVGICRGLDELRAESNVFSGMGILNVF
jgi:hypothetical protein